MFVGAYWGKRKESKTESAERIVNALLKLSKYSSEFSTWFLKAQSERLALKNKVELTYNVIHSILDTNRSDVNGTAMPELGFDINIWNGSNRFPASFSATCGAYSDFVKNCAVLQFYTSENDITFLSPEKIRSILVDFIHSFDPDDAVVSSHEFISHMGGGTPSEAGGWLVYKRNNGLNNIAEKGELGKIE